MTSISKARTSSGVTDEKHVVVASAKVDSKPEVISSIEEIENIVILSPFLLPIEGL